MSIKIFTFNPVQEHTFVLYDDTKECVIVDPGCFFPEEKKELMNFIKDNNLVVKKIINTHLHFDHTFGLNYLADELGFKTEAHQGDEYLLTQLPNQYIAFGFGEYTEPIPQIGKYLTEDDTIRFGNQILKIFHVPGHSPGSIVFYNEAEKYAVVGDVLFSGSIGRTDLPGGDMNQLLNGIRTKLFSLPDDTVIYPGHGPATTIGKEKQTNPFF